MYQLGQVPSKDELSLKIFLSSWIVFKGGGGGFFTNVWRFFNQDLWQHFAARSENGIRKLLTLDKYFVTKIVSNGGNSIKKVLLEGTCLQKCYMGFLKLKIFVCSEHF